jgi:RNA polymerase sigma-70 factor (ECF subfamily)
MGPRRSENFLSTIGKEGGMGEASGHGADRELIRDSLDQPDVFVGIFDRHFRSIYGYLARRLGSDLASDLASEVFARAFEARRRYDMSQPDAAPWLYGIATNLVRHHHRAEARRLRAYASLAPELSVAAHGESWNDPRIARALVNMRSADREVLLLFVWGDLEYAQIAALLGVPVGTVRSRLHRARKQLRRAVVSESMSLEEALDG